MYVLNYMHLKYDMFDGVVNRKKIIEQSMGKF